MVVTDIALADIVAKIAVHRPERGGALYGPRDFPLVTHFDFDADAATTSVSYVPSLRLIERVRKVERETALKFKGIIHSHPDGMTRPSRGDCESASNLLHHNSHISSIAMPIVQQVREGAAQRTRPFIHWYTAERRSGGTNDSTPSRRPRGENPRVEILDEDFRVLPIHEHCKALVAHLRQQGFALKIQAGAQPLQIEQVQLIGLIMRSTEGHEIMYFVSVDYPIVGPVVLYGSGGATKNLLHGWDGLSSVEDSLGRVAELLANSWGKGSSVKPDALERRSSRWPWLREDDH